MEFTSKIINKRDVAKDTMSFYFQKPDEFVFKAGQYMKLTLINPAETDDEGNNRLFSIAAAPHEKDLMITTRMRDTAFKRVLKRMNIGDEIKIQGPMGVFTLQNANIPAVFLVGGIGITPFRSMILDVTKKMKSQKIILFYSNHSMTETVFFDELQETANANPNFIFVPIMTRDETWDGEKEHINELMLEKYVHDLDNAIYYSAGPQQMVESMRKILKETGIPDEKVIYEDFSGY
jgi:ferredoxin-NADP reductase